MVKIYLKMYTFVYYFHSFIGVISNIYCMKLNFSNSIPI